MARRADRVEDGDGEEGMAYSGEEDMPTPKMQVNHKSTSSWCHHLPRTLPQTRRGSQKRAEGSQPNQSKVSPTKGGKKCHRKGSKDANAIVHRG